MWPVAIAIAGSVLTAIVAGLITYETNRRRENEAEWRKLKFAQYQELALAISGILEGRSTPEAQARYCDAYNSMNVFAPPHVLRALQEYQEEISCANRAKDAERQGLLTNSLLRAIRADMHARKSPDDGDLEFHLIRPPPQS